MVRARTPQDIEKRKQLFLDHRSLYHIGTPLLYEAQLYLGNLLYIANLLHAIFVRLHL